MSVESLLPGAEFHHVAYVVPELELASTAWQKTFGATVELPPTTIQAHGVLVTFLRFGAARVELVQPASQLSAARVPPVGAGRPDHLCFLCDDLGRLLGLAAEKGAAIVKPPVPSEAFGGRRMAFLYFRDVGLLEWVER